jgi:hypothetical protein
MKGMREERRTEMEGAEEKKKMWREGRYDVWTAWNGEMVRSYRCAYGEGEV